MGRARGAGWGLRASGCGLRDEGAGCGVGTWFHVRQGCAKYPEQLGFMLDVPCRDEDWTGHCKCKIGFVPMWNIAVGRKGQRNDQHEEMILKYGLKVVWFSRHGLGKSKREFISFISQAYFIHFFNIFFKFQQVKYATP